MLNQIYGKENLEDFGVYVTADNVDEQIKERERRSYALLAEYGETGEIQLGKAYDESYLMDALIFPDRPECPAIHTDGLTQEEIGALARLADLMRNRRAP